MNLKLRLFFVSILLYNTVWSQEYLIEITLSKVTMVKECHFGDEWSAYFSFGGEYTYQSRGDKFVLKPNQSFPLHSIIYEENEEYNDYEKTTSIISYDSLGVGLFKFVEYLYVEDENKGRYRCNNATFKFDYLISVADRRRN
jgi:hypothetical protein